MRTLGIDLGGTYARAAVVNEEGGLLSSAKTLLHDRSPAAVVEAIAGAALEAAKGCGLSGLDGLDACGVGAAAQLKGGSGVVAVAPNLGWRDIPFGAMLAERLRRPVRVVNDLSAAAWGEHRAGAARGVRDVFVVFVGSGVGSAIISSGTLVSGSTGVAGEFGHIKIVPEGRPCGCGERGCLEAYAGGHNLIAQMRETMAADEKGELARLSRGNPEVLTPVLLEQAVRAGDGAARELHDRVGGFLALGIANQVTVLNPGKLILGGGVLTRCPMLRQRIVDGVERYASMVSRRGLVIADAELGDDSGLIGAGLLALERVPA